MLASAKAYRWKADVSDVEIYILVTVNCDSFVRSVSNLFGEGFVPCQLGLLK